MATGPATAAEPGPGLAPVRLPVQDRSRATWQRILDVSVEVLAESGVNGFTISAICERAGVAPTAIYSRVNGREGLITAVYEHGMRGIEAAEAELDRVAATGPDPRRAVHVLASVFDVSPGFLRAIVLASPFQPYFSERGASNVERSRDRFIRACVGKRATKATREKAGLAFSVVFSSLLVRVAYGPEFTGSASDQHFIEHLADLVSDSLAGAVAGPRTAVRGT